MNLLCDFIHQNRGAYISAYAGVSVAVYVAGTNTLATLYETDGTTPKTNPLTTDANGQYIAKTPAGTVDIVASKDGIELIRLPGITFSGFDGTDVVISGGSIDGVVIGASNPAEGNFTDLNYNGNLSGGGV